MKRLLVVFSAVLMALYGVAAPAFGGTGRIRHVFVINLENKGFDRTWGTGSAAPYLSQTLRAQGELLTQYYGTAHASLGNYIAQISGQGPNPATQLDCPFYFDFLRIATVSSGQAAGLGCVYPSSVRTVADQLSARGLSWKGYMQDMGTPCRHPSVNSFDSTQQAKADDEYAARHNPFVYFHSIIDSPSCASRVVDLSSLPLDLAGSVPNLAYITPDLCEDGHDAPCADGRPGGLTSADAFLRTWVPRIMASAAYRSGGLIVITFDESDGPTSDSSACCGEGPGPNTPLPGLLGLGGGRVGALLLSPYVSAGTSSSTPYNHYGLLRTIEDLFGLGHLGYASTVSGFFAEP